MSNIFPLFLLKSAEKSYMVKYIKIKLVELRNGETFNGTLM